MNLGASEIVLVLIVVLLLFGGKRLPELARSLGKGIGEFRRATQAVQREINSPIVEAPPKPIHSPNLPETNSPEPSRAVVNAHPAAQPRTPQEPPPPDH